MPPERDVLLACARASLRPEDDRRLRDAVERGVDWERLHALASRNRVLPLLARHLGTLEAVPGDVRARLREEAAGAARRALRLAGELVRLMDAFAFAGVRACAYKGPALAARAYGDLGLRQMSDLDVLVHPDDASRAAEVLTARGYLPRHRLTPKQDALFRRVDGDYPFVHGETGKLVELHTRVSPARFAVRLETPGLLARAVPVRVGGGEIPALADDDLVLALAVHGAKHRWERLEWVAAFAGVLRGGDIDLARVLARAEEAGARRTLLLALRLARGLLDAPVPAELAAAADADAGVARLAAEAEERIFRDPSPGDAEEDATAANLRYNLRLRDVAADRLRFGWRWLTVPSPEDWDALRLPDPLFPLYRAVRPVRLALRYGARALRRR